MIGASVLTANDWPIAAAMLPFPDAQPADDRWTEDVAGGWASSLEAVAALGFTDADLTDSWLRPGDLSAPQLDGLAQVAASAGIRFRAVSAIRRSILDEAQGEAHLAYAHRTLEAAAALGSTVVSFGLHRALTAEQRERLWFWTIDGHRDSDTPEERALAVARFRELGTHAAELGLLLSLEMYEDTLLGSASSSVRLVEEIGMVNVGLNPDLGNLIRAHHPIEDWRTLVRETLPWANYWHVKNYLRDEAADGRVTTLPSSMEGGLIDYRFAIAVAIEGGYQGVIGVEHYGGDGLGMSAANRDYLRRSVLPRSPEYALGVSRVEQRTTPPSFVATGS